MPILLSSRAVLRIDGADAASFLQGLLTQDVEAAKSAPVFSALLSPQGKILFEFLIAPSDGGFLLDCAADMADALYKRLVLYRLRAKVGIERLEGLCVIADADGDAGFIDPRLPALGRRAFVSAAPAGAEPEAAHDARRIAAGVPELGKDFAADDMFLLDVNYDALNAVSYRKGCFVGQEVTSRMKRKGEVRRRTLIARIPGTPPARGAAATAGDSTLGEILSAADGAALALIRLDRLTAAKADGRAVMVEGRAAEIVFPSYLELP